MAEFGEMLSELRQDCHLSQKELARLLNVSPGTVSNYETGRYSPSIPTVIWLANYFNVTTDYLLGRAASNVSARKLEEQFINEKTVGDMANLLSSLHGKNRKLAYDILEAIRVYDAVNK